MKTNVQPPDKTSGTPFRSRGSNPLGVQTKKFVNKPGDKHEVEADQAADRVVNGSTPAGTNANGDPSAVQLKPIAQNVTPYIQRKESADQMGQLDIESTEDQMGAINYKGPEIQRKEDDLINATQALTSEEDNANKTAFNDQLTESKGQGAPLPMDVKSEMEGGFGADFNNVRTHTGTKAADMNQSLGAKAFTNQGDIYFNEGKFDPNSKEGKHLLAHELTHTIQQGASKPKGEKNTETGEKKEINSSEVAAAKNKAKESPGITQKAEKLAGEAISEAKTQPVAKTTASDPNAEKAPVQQETEQEIDAKKAADSKTVTGEGKENAAENAEGQKKPEALDEAVEKEISEKTKEEAPDKEKEKQKAPAPKQKDEKEKEEKKEPGEEDKKGEDPGPEGVKEDYDNPPPVKDAKVEEATDKAGEGVGVDEEANVNVEGLIMTAQQFRDQGKESVKRAKTQAEERERAEKKMREIDQKIAGSDKTLQTAEKNTLTREKQIPKIMDKALATSKQRQEKVSSEVGTYSSEYNKNKGTANDLKKESSDLNKGSKENSNPDEKESGELSSNYEEMESGTATMAEGISGTGDTAAKLKADAVTSKNKNAKTEKELKESKANIQKSKQKISSEKGRNNDAKAKSKAQKPKFQKSKQQEEQLTTEGMSLMKTSFEMENETHRAQYFYYKDMKSIEGADEMIMQEELKAQSEMSNGPEALLFKYSNLKGEAEREAFVASLSESDRMALGMQLQAFNMNFEAWVETKKLEFGERVEQRRAKEINTYNAKRNKGLESPLNKATKNIDKISKTGLLWTSMTKTLESMWEGLKNITWADVSKIGWAMINPLETYNTIADAVGGIWTDLSDWKGFSEDPVGMILQKGSSVGVKLLTIAGVITGLLGVLSVLTSVAAFFFPPLIPVAAWLISATGTMFSVTFWIGLITTALSVMSGIKNIYNVHTAKTAEQIFQGNHKLKQDAANTATGVMAMVGAKSPPAPINMEKIGKWKNVAVRTFKAGKSFVKGGVRKIPKLVSAAFKKQTWTDLYAGFKKFAKKKSDNLFGGDKKKITGKTDQISDAAPKKVLKNADNPKAPTKNLPEKQKTAHIDSKAPAKTPEAEIHPTKNTPDVKKADTELSDANIKEMKKGLDPEVTEIDEVKLPKDQQVANGKKEPKSKIMEDDPNIKDKDLDNFKKYEDDVDASQKQKMKDDADAEVKKGKDHDSKSKALMMARVIAEANDELDTPIPALLAELAPLKAMKGVKGFDYKKGNAPGEFRIVMYGSEYIVDPSYTTKRQRDFDKEVQKRLEKGEIDEDMAKKLREYNKKNPSGKRTVDNTIKQYEDKRTLTDRGDFITDLDDRPKNYAKYKDTKFENTPKSAMDQDLQDHMDFQMGERNKGEKLSAGKSKAKEGTQAEADFKKGQKQMRDASELIGEKGAIGAIRKHFPDAEVLYTGKGSGTFDLVLKNGDEFIILEAKGGASKLGFKNVKGILEQQGTKQYRDALIKTMRSSKDPATKKIAQELLKTSPKKIKYFHSNTPIKKGKISDTILKEFK
ncbi:DUF4157 domain-containing protein [Fluviicola sp.]|uniref:eCIS core domain-containing protein n=1 Tax=Fluviicola sp. TaxID=1917219 RepID=UPI0031D00206